MPMYEFKCDKCGAEFEELATLAEVETGEVTCPNCGARKVKRQLSTFACGTDGGSAATGGGCGHAGFG